MTLLRSLLAEVQIDRTAPDVVVRAPGWALTVQAAPAGVVSALARLASGWLADSELAECVVAVPDAGGEVLATWYYCLAELQGRGAVRYAVQDRGRMIAALVPNASRGCVVPADVPEQQRYALSTLAYARRIGDVVEVRSPVACGRVDLVSPEARSLFAELWSGGSAESLGHAVPGVAGDTARTFLALFVGAGLVAECGAADERAGEPEPDCWEFADLLFHHSSRPVPTVLPQRVQSCRHAPPFAPAMSGDVIDLPGPDHERLVRSDMPLARVMSRRASIRRYHPEHIVSLAEIGEFLTRVARVKGPSAGPVPDDDVSRRSYPSAGARYPLELYGVVRVCDGLGPGTYHYDPLHHRLERMPVSDEYAARMLSTARDGMGGHETPQVLIVITARFGRVFSHYRDVAYALILKDVGVMIEAMYLAATAMGLAPCALGAGDGAVFAAATGLDSLDEAPLASFALGSAP